MSAEGKMPSPKVAEVRSAATQDDEHSLFAQSAAKEAKDEEKKRWEAIECPKVRPLSVLSIHCLRQPAFTSLRPIKGGVLTKQGAKFKSWKVVDSVLL
jgi:hypothetical protein